jgi:hypothetical protein
MNNWEVKNQRIWNWNQSKILSVSLVGNSDTLDTIKTILDRSGHVMQLVYNKMSDIITQMQDLKNQTEGKSEFEIEYIIEEISKKKMNEAGIIGDLQESINNEYNNAPEYFKNPINQILMDESQVNNNPNQNIISSLLNGVTAKAEGRWDVNMKSVWCGWAPCGMKLFLGAVHQNALAFTVGSGSTFWATTKGATWIYNVFNKLTYLCGPAIIQRNVALYASSYAMIMYLSTTSFSFETKCEYARWATGVEYELSFNKGIRIAKCSKGI